MRFLLSLIFTGSLFIGSSFAQTFTLTEQFGANWTDQIIEFQYSGTQSSISGKKMMLSVNGGASAEVPFQWIPASDCTDEDATVGCIVVRSNLSAGATNTWTLVSGTPSATATNPVQLATVGNNYELTNGLTGVRIVTASGNAGPYTTQVQSPIQGIRLADGTWTGQESSPNYFYSESQGQGFKGQAQSGTLTTKTVNAISYTVSIVDQGPLKTTLQASYTFNRPQYFYGVNNFAVTNVTSGSGSTPIIVTVDAKLNPSCGNGYSNNSGSSCFTPGQVDMLTVEGSSLVVPTMVQITGITGTGSISSANASL